MNQEIVGSLSGGTHIRTAQVSFLSWQGAGTGGCWRSAPTSWPHEGVACTAALGN